MNYNKKGLTEMLITIDLKQNYRWEFMKVPAIINKNKKQSTHKLLVIINVHNYCLNSQHVE